MWQLPKLCQVQSRSSIGLCIDPCLLCSLDIMYAARYETDYHHETRLVRLAEFWSTAFLILGLASMPLGL